MAENTYTPAQKAAYKSMRFVEAKIEHTGRTQESLMQIAKGMKVTGDTEGLKLIIPLLKRTMAIRQAAKAELHPARAAYYALFTSTPEDVTLTEDESAAFDALAALLDD